MRHAKTLLATAAVLFALGHANRAQAGGQTCLETVGGMSAGYLYNTYLVIGLTGDAFAKGAYDKAKVKQLMGEQVRLMDNALKQLGKLMKSGLAADDKSYVRQINTTLHLLKKQASALSAFAGNGSNKNAQKFESARKKSWAKIAKLLGLPG